MYSLEIYCHSWGDFFLILIFLVSFFLCCLFRFCGLGNEKINCCTCLSILSPYILKDLEIFVSHYSNTVL